jgi:lipid A disaccharide synthetase
VSTPIEYITTKELVDELKKRFDEMAFIGFAVKTSKEDGYSICIKSTMHGAFGLINVLAKAAEAEAS